MLLPPVKVEMEVILFLVRLLLLAAVAVEIILLQAE
jgi:hypothetical protein